MYGKQCLRGYTVHTHLYGEVVVLFLDDPLKSDEKFSYSRELFSTQ
jgi:hypothetical protein